MAALPTQKNENEEFLPDMLEKREPPILPESPSWNQDTVLQASLSSFGDGSIEIVQESFGFREFTRQATNVCRHGPSPLQAMTVGLVRTYIQRDPNYGYSGKNDPRRVLTKPSRPAKNNGFDNEEGDYIVRVHDVIGEQYKVIDLLGKGSFGQVVKCVEMATGQLVSIKIMKNKHSRRQSNMEMDIIRRLHKELRPEERQYILTLHNSFEHKNHICLVFELLSVNLFELLQQNKLCGLSIHLIRQIAARLMESLAILGRAKIIHCDLKPENILLARSDSPVVKVIDYGSACFESDASLSYIQSRFYRAPEVLLGCRYTTAIDMWSLGCVIAELYIGIPLFPGHSAYNQLQRIIDFLGTPPTDMLDRGCFNTPVYFNKIHQDKTYYYSLKPLEQYNQERKKHEIPGRAYIPYHTLDDVIMNHVSQFPASSEDRQSLLDLLKGILRIDPRTRWTPDEARHHPFLTGQPFLGPYNPKESSLQPKAPPTKTQGPMLPDHQPPAPITVVESIDAVAHADQNRETVAVYPSGKVKHVPMLKVRYGSRDSLRMPDEIRVGYETCGSSPAKIAGQSNARSHTALHAGEAAGGMLMMQQK